jgi:hypothetical protein
MIKPKIVLLIFVSGKIVLTGAKVREEIYQAFENIYPTLTGKLVRPVTCRLRLTCCRFPQSLITSAECEVSQQLYQQQAILQQLTPVRSMPTACLCILQAKLRHHHTTTSCFYHSCYDYLRALHGVLSDSPSSCSLGRGTKKAMVPGPVTPH